MSIGISDSSYKWHFVFEKKIKSDLSNWFNNDFHPIDIQFNSVYWPIKGPQWQQENCTYMNKQYAQ